MWEVHPRVSAGTEDATEPEQTTQATRSVVFVERDRLSDRRVRLDQRERRRRGDHIHRAVALGKPLQQRQGKDDVAEVGGLDDQRRTRRLGRRRLVPTFRVRSNGMGICACWLGHPRHLTSNRLTA